MISKEELNWAEQYFRATNYISAASIYLKNNFLLEKQLKPTDIKDSLLGHWGTSPGLNFIYTHLNLMITKKKANVLMVIGPGHGFAAILSNQYLEGSLKTYYHEYTLDKTGFGNIIKSFCWPGGFPSHLNPGVPGCIHEGGELGYALATAFGSVLDNPDLITVCVVGDGEAETGPTATAWHSTKYIDPKTNGAVLPIIHLNGYKISSPTIYGTMSNQELTSLFTGYGYEIKFVGQNHKDMANAIEWAYSKIIKIQQAARTGKPIVRPAWPLIILKTEKGWTGIKSLDGKKITGSYRSHQVPAKDAKTNPKSLRALEAWLKSYRPQQFFDKENIKQDLLKFVPLGNLRIGSNPNAIGGNLRKSLVLPDMRKFAVPIKVRGSTFAGSTSILGQYLKEIFKLNQAQRNFRIMSPDELASNKLDAVLEVTGRAYTWPHSKEDKSLKPDGRVMEMLSEHTLQGWLQGYILTGRYGIFPSYEAFLPIVDSMVSQYLKFIEMSQDYNWRPPVASLTYILTSVCWRQDHNGFSHQNPGFINTLLNKAREEQLVRTYFPADANISLVVLDHCLRSTNRINIIVSDKQPIRQWLTIDEAIKQCRVGAAVWEFASHDNPDVVLAACGDYQTQEGLATIQLLRKFAPELKVRFVNVNELNTLGMKPFYPNGLDDVTFNGIFTQDKQVVFSFHGYPGAIKQLLFDRPSSHRFHIYGYIEKGTTTTPFDMVIRNNVSRYHLAIRLVKYAAETNPKIAVKAAVLVATFEAKILEHREFILKHGADPEEIATWNWHY